jgi:hypothetical protein
MCDVTGVSIQCKNHTGAMIALFVCCTVVIPCRGIIFRHAQALLIFLDVQIAASVYSNKHDGKNNIPCERTGTARGTGTIAFPCRTQNRRENSRKKAHRVAPENSKELTIQGEKKNRKL